MTTLIWLRLALLILIFEGISASATPSLSSGERTVRPVVGVFAQRTETVTQSTGIDPEVKSLLSAYPYFIPASYVSWIGQAGGRVLPVILDQPEEYYKHVFEVTNGLLLPGGNQNIDPDEVYTEEGKVLWEMAKAANDGGDYYPIWGTCLGFEEMAVLQTDDGDVISNDVVATNAAMSLVFAPGAVEASRLFEGFPSSVIESLQTKNITFNSHDHGLLVETYSSNDALRSFFRVLSYNVAPKGQIFVSTMESRDYPFYGVQWHPEKNNFEFSANARYSNIPHFSEAIALSQATANFFLDEARRSEHRFPEDRRDDLVSAATLIYTGKADWTYEQVYVFES